MSDRATATSAPAVEIRACAPDDAQAVVDLLRAVYAPFATDFPPTALRETPESVAADAAAWLVAVRDDGRVVAAVRHEPEDDYHTFAFLSVLPEHRRQGLGDRLLDAVTDAAGRRRLVIVLRDALRANVAYFERRGFVREAPFGRTGEHHLFERAASTAP